jgi:hypothetical protein
VLVPWLLKAQANKAKRSCQPAVWYRENESTQ